MSSILSQNASLEPRQAPALAADPSAFELEPGWRSLDPKLLAILLAATPACTVGEAYRSGETITHELRVGAPSVSQSELESRFRSGAEAAGYRLDETSSLGVSLEDKTKQVQGWLEWSGNIRLLVPGKDGVRNGTIELATRYQLETASLFEALGEEGTWSWVELVRNDYQTMLQVSLRPTAEQRRTLGAWAKQRGLEASDDGWVRRKGRDIVVAIHMGEARASVDEVRDGGIPGAACATDPSHNQR